MDPHQGVRLPLSRVVWPAETDYDDFNPRLLAEAIVRVTADPALLKRLVEAVEKPDRDAFQRLVTEQKLDAYCHLFCHWICAVRYRLICHWLCSPDRPRRPDFIGELQAAGRALRLLLAKRDVFDAADEASNAGDAAKLGAILRGPELFQLCYLICEWFCSLRCVLACLTLCRQFPLTAIETRSTKPTSSAARSVNSRSSRQSCSA